MSTPLNPNDFLGKKFNRLLVLELLEPSKGRVNKGGIYRCQCECGKEVTARGYHLSDNRAARSCGCSTRKDVAFASISKRGYEKSTINNQYSLYVNAGKSRGFGYLSKDEWLKIVFLPCFYCDLIDTRTSLCPSKDNCKLFPLSPEERARYTIKINGIDRIDSNLGYVIGNCVPCCTMCNRMKLAHSQEDFFLQIKRVYDKHVKSMDHVELILP